MNAQTQNLQELCFRNPALRTLLQFDMAGSKEIAVLNSAEFRFSILYDKTENGYLVHYRIRCKRNPANICPEGYIRCNNFSEVIEALNEQAEELKKGTGISSHCNHLPAKALWLGLDPLYVAPDFRTRFILAIHQIKRSTKALSVHTFTEVRANRWTAFLRPFVLSA